MRDQRNHRRSGSSPRLRAGLAALCLLASVLPAVWAAAPASAYNLEGCVWRTKTVQLQLGRGSYNGPSQNAAFSWNTQDGKRHAAFRWKVVRSRGQVLERAKSFGNTSFAGLTMYRCIRCAGCRIARFLAPVHVYFNTYYTRSYTGKQRQVIMAHELGHALGLAHTFRSACPVITLMHPNLGPFLRCGFLGPRPDDVNGVKHMYH